jgi:hypothetical protein
MFHFFHGSSIGRNEDIKRARVGVVWGWATKLWSLIISVIWPKIKCSLSLNDSCETLKKLNFLLNMLTDGLCRQPPLTYTGYVEGRVYTDGPSDYALENLRLGAMPRVALDVAYADISMWLRWGFRPSTPCIVPEVIVVYSAVATCQYEVNSRTFIASDLPVYLGAVASWCPRSSFVRIAAAKGMYDMVKTNACGFTSPTIFLFDYRASVVLSLLEYIA